MSEVFISYSRKDKRCAQLVASAVQKRGIGVWWDTNLEEGKTFDDEIELALKAAGVVIVLWSRYSIE